MKKLTLFLAAAVVMASCTKSEEVFTGTPQEIGFSAYSQKATRAAVAGTTFPTDRTMNVSAMYHHENGTHETYFSNVKFSHAGGSWKGGWYYPLNGSIDFMAYSTVSNATADWTLNETSGKIESVKLTFPTALNGEEDVMYSDSLANVSCPQSASKALTFRHALAWLNFTVKAKSDAAASAIKVNSITVNNVSLSGVATVTAGSPSTVAWSDKSAAASTAVPGFATATALTTTAQNVGNGLLVVPGDQTSFTINYTIKNGAAEPYTEKTMNYTFDLSAGDATWVDAKKYIYNISIDLKEITFTANVVDYTTESADKEIE